MLTLQPLRAFKQGNALLVALISIFTLTIVAGEVMRTVIPRYQLTIQTAGWQEARLAAEAGVERAMVDLNAAKANYGNGYAWNGWLQEGDTGLLQASGTSLLRDTNNVITPGNVLVGGAGSLFLDDFYVPPTSGLKARADVEIAALYPDPDTDHTANTWFRIRSMGSSEVAGPRRIAVDSMDATLRRMSFVNFRESLMGYDHGKPITDSLMLPIASRVVEVLACSVSTNSRAITSSKQMTLGQSAGWKVDSYDSRDPSKSAPNPAYPGDTTRGIYPRDSSGEVQSNGSVGTGSQLIKANGAIVKGNAETKDGVITDSKNITGAITTGFNEELTPEERPSVAIYQPPVNYSRGEAFVSGGTRDNPLYYLVASDLGSFSVAPPPSGVSKAYVTILVNGQLNLGNGRNSYITVPPGVTCKVYVRGNMELGNGMVNTNTSSSSIPAQLVINGERTYLLDGSIATKTANASGNAVVAAVLNAPDYDARINGTVEWYGSVITNFYTIEGGGNGGMHYDEALSVSGAISGFRICRYYENSRQ